MVRLKTNIYLRFHLEHTGINFSHFSQIKVIDILCYCGYVTTKCVYFVKIFIE